MMTNQRGQTTRTRRTPVKVSLGGLVAALVLLSSCSRQPLAESAPNRQTQQQQQQQHYYGALIGRLTGRSHNVSGDVYAVDEQTLFIRGFTYDGQAPDAYFWSSVSSPQPAAAEGFIVPDEKGSTKPLERYSDKDLVLRLPEGKTLREVNWLSVWSRQTQESLGDLLIGRQLTVPRPLEIAPLSQLAHGVRSGPITVVDAQTLLVPDFHYDGLGPDAYFWLTRSSSSLGAAGLRLKDENGSPGPLRKYSGETVVISLPDELTVYDFDFFGVWCRKYQVNFGQTRIPQAAKVPPSPKMLGIKPENKLNCEILYDDLGYEIRWVLDGDDIVMQLVGKIEPGEYMAFGLGKDDARSDMTNADAVVAWVDRASGQVHAVDYFLGGRAQCQNDPRGSCPDSKLAGGGDSLTLLHGAIVNGYSMVTFKRPQLGVDELYDQHVYSDGQQSVLWAIGSLNAQNEVGYHRLRTRSNMFIDFARNPQWNCPIPDLNATMHSSSSSSSLPVVPAASQVDATMATGSEQSADQPPREPERSAAPPETSAPVISERSSPITRPQPTPELADSATAASRSEPQQVTSGQTPGSTAAATNNRSTGAATQGDSAAWFIPSIVCPAERTFYAQIGPTGGKRGFEAITGRPSWGVSWYVNGLMVPELVLQRGQSYLFVVEGGNDKTSLTRRHPLYLTDSPEGGFDFKTDEERLKERIFAGVALRADGQLVPTAEGRLCEWKPTNSTLQNPDLYPTFAAYQRSLKLHCMPGQASVMKFAPDESTPDLIYYQCYTHRSMGWRLRVVDSCEAYLKSASPTQRAFSNNNMKRDTGDRTEQPTERPTYDRRFSLAETTTLGPASGERRLSFLDFGGEETTASSINNELASIPPSDLLILNSSHLNQRQPFNLSSFEEILKLSPADLEFIDNQPEIPLESFVQANAFTGLFPLALPLQNYTINGLSENQQAQSGGTTNKTSTSNKLPKTLHSYMRRLAAIYYPVQQQLASMLVAQSAHPAQPQPQLQHRPPLQQLPHSTLAKPTGRPGGGNQNNHLQAASTDQVSSFSLSNLVPKSKIDLSKSGLSKKLNKLRFKQKDSYSQKPSQPPTPAIEFNYDIFNNQLAKLEKQQKQLQSMDHFMSWPPVQQSSSEAPLAAYLPMVDQQTAQQAPSQFFSNVLQQPSPVGAAQSSQQAAYINQQQSQKYLSDASLQLAAKIRAAQMQTNQRPLMPIGPQAHQAYSADYLSSLLNRTNGVSAQQQPQAVQWLQNQPQNELQQHPPHLRVPHQQQPAIYITRLPLQQTYPIYVQAPTGQQTPHDPAHIWPNSVQLGASIRYPNIHPYASHHQKSAPIMSAYKDQDFGANQMTTMPSVAQTTHDTRHELAGQMISHESDPTSYMDQLKSQQSTQSGHLIKATEPSEQVLRNQQPIAETDHMLAIERFSKQPSERRPPSIVHPVTGEQVRFGQQQWDPQSSSPPPPPNKTNSTQQPRRFSNMLIDKYLLASSEPSVPLLANDLSGDTRETFAGDLRRLNGSDTSLPGAQAGNQEPVKEPPSSSPTPNSIEPLPAQQPTTTEITPHVLVRPGYFHFREPLATTMPTVGPLVPSLGPPSVGAPTGDGETVLKSTLVEPITSTLIQDQPSAGHTSSLRTAPILSHHHFDSGPFTPIELTNPFYYSGLAAQQFQGGPVNLIGHRLKPPPFIESMLSQHQSPLRPEPPVQVASYLAQHLSSHNPMLIASEKSVASSQPMALSVALPAQSAPGQPKGSSSGVENNNSNSVPTNDLIILKPTQLSKQVPQAYLLRPEYLGQFRLVSGAGGALASSDPHLSGELGPARRLAGHQFDRLSSLSSPPSTSIAVDPMQAANTVTSIVKQATLNQVSSTITSNATILSSSSSPTTAEAKQSPTKALEGSSPQPSNLVTGDKVQAQHRQSHLPSKPIPLNFDTQNTSSSPEGIRFNPSAESSGPLFRDNNTDNAILSHVMSLISANAIPTPPLVPVASYSSADYFLPISDRTHRSIRG